ncbi:MAG TPA: phosphotransferase, partial [Pirellulales bacterium]|nr:phosphotransferase [Pirellulales bacterium]
QPSPGIARRLAMAQRLARGELASLRAPMDADRWPELAELARRYYELARNAAGRLIDELRRAAEWVVPMQLCLRDVWRDNVLFRGSELSAIVDFGAIGVESVAGDIARLLGSFVADDRAAWQIGLTAYEAIRPLSPPERELVETFDRANVTLSGLNWIGWVFQERRSFEQPAAVMARMEHFLGRVEALARSTIELQSRPMIW